MSTILRLLAAARLAAVVGMSAGGIVVLSRLGERPYFHIDWSDLGGWLAVTPPEDALVAGVRVLALGVAWWVLGSTVLYVAARATGLPAALRAVEWATLPAVRRVADRAVAVTLAGSTVLGAAAPAVAADRDPPAVMPTAVVVQADEVNGPHGESDRTAEAGGYVPVPAGGNPGPGDDALPPGAPEFRLPLPEAPAPVSPPPVTALPPEREAGEEVGEATASPEVGGEAQVASTAPPPEDGPDDPAMRATADERRSDSDPEAPAPATHTVAPGDHLWGIAERTLAAAWGRPPSTGELLGYWRQLVAANRARLASGDPDLIYPGEVVDLPAIPAEQE